MAHIMIYEAQSCTEETFFCCLKQVGDPDTPPAWDFVSDYAEINERDPEIVVCRQDGESVEDFVDRCNSVSAFMCGA